jgi:hypothetical protein
MYPSDRAIKTAVAKLRDEEVSGCRACRVTPTARRWEFVQRTVINGGEKVSR